MKEPHCPVCYSRLTGEHRELKQWTLSGHAVGASPSPVETPLEGWAIQRFFECGLATESDPRRSGGGEKARAQCSKAMSVALRLREEAESEKPDV